MMQGIHTRARTASIHKIAERAQTKLLQIPRYSQRTWVILCVVLSLIIIVPVVVTLPFKGTFIRRCKGFRKYSCQNLWSLFQQAYVGKDPCEVPMEAYDPLIAAAPFKPACNRMIFWSKTKNLVKHSLKKRECFLTLEKTLLGSVLDGLTWCGEEGSSETFTSSCPGWRKCENNPVSSFWRRASAAFADVACGDITAVLDGSIETPFDPKSIFGSIELKRFKSPRVRSLKIVLVSGKKAVSNCMNPSLQDLQGELDAGITYSCTEMTESQFNQCSSDPETCW